MIAVIVVCIVLPFLHPNQATQECEPGKITGISCSTPAEMSRQFHPKIEELKHRLTQVNHENGLRIAETKTLINKNIASSKNNTNHQIANLRNSVLLAKQEARGAPIFVQTCIVKQDTELAKIHTNSLVECNSLHSFTKVEDVRKKFYKLTQTVIGLASHCLFLNPLRQEMNHLKLCIETKINEIKLEIVLIQKEFDDALNEVIQKSVDCILKGSSSVSEKIGGVLGAIKGCKNLYLYNEK